MSDSSFRIVVVSEEMCRRLVTTADSFTAVEAAFAAMAAEEAVNFPVVRQALGHADALYGFKSGFDHKGMTLGVKSGGYWPQNLARHSLTNHQSSVLLFDPDTGRLQAIVGGNHLTALRTAAATAVSIRHLSRPDSEILGIMGAGHQSAFQIRAALEQRGFKKIIGWNRSPAGLDHLAEIAENCGVAFESASPELLAQTADVIVTITSSHAALLPAAHIKAGSHIAAMGTDTKGKQELDPAIFSRAEIFTDEVAQSISIGEAQHAVMSGLVAPSAITPIGLVINGAHAGRSSRDAITVFDGTGVGLQDLALARVAVSRALQANEAQLVSL